jgi:hypothetical protein
MQINEAWIHELDRIAANIIGLLDYEKEYDGTAFPPNKGSKSYQKHDACSTESRLSSTRHTRHSQAETETLNAGLRELKRRCHLYRTDTRVTAEQDWATLDAEFTRAEAAQREAKMVRRRKHSLRKMPSFAIPGIPGSRAESGRGQDPTLYMLRQMRQHQPFSNVTNLGEAAHNT